MLKTRHRERERERKVPGVMVYRGGKGKFTALCVTSMPARPYGKVGSRQDRGW